MISDNEFTESEEKLLRYLKQFLYQTLDDHLSKQCKRYDLSFEQKNREVSQIKQKLEEINDLKLEIQNLHSSDKEIHNQIYDLIRDFEQ